MVPYIAGERVVGRRGVVDDEDEVFPVLAVVSCVDERLLWSFVASDILGGSLFALYVWSSPSDVEWSKRSSCKSVDPKSCLSFEALGKTTSCLLSPHSVEFHVQEVKFETMQQAVLHC